jgi:hypothetical protein
MPPSKRTVVMEQGRERGGGNTSLPTSGFMPKISIHTVYRRIAENGYLFRKNLATHFSEKLKSV